MPPAFQPFNLLHTLTNMSLLGVRAFFASSDVSASHAAAAVSPSFQLSATMAARFNGPLVNAEVYSILSEDCLEQLSMSRRVDALTEARPRAYEEKAITVEDIKRVRDVGALINAGESVVYQHHHR